MVAAAGAHRLMLECQVHGHLQVLGLLEFDIDPNELQKTPNEEVCMSWDS